MPVTHLYFDFFGTLVGYSPSLTEQGHEGSYAILREAGFEGGYDGFLDLWKRVFGRLEQSACETLREFSMEEVGAAFLREAIGEARGTIVRDFAQTYLAEWNRGVVYEDTVLEWLPRLAERFRLGIVTNTHDLQLVPGHLDRMGVASLFDVVVTSIGAGDRKPSPRIFERALAALSATAEGSVYVGDSYEADFVGASAAGLDAYLIDPEDGASIPEEKRLRSVVELGDRLGFPL